MLRKARKRLADRDVISPQRRKDAEISAENTVGNGERWRERGIRFDAETRGRGGRRGEEGREKARASGVPRAVSGGSGEDGGKTSELRSDGQARRPILQRSDAECGWVSGENTFENGERWRERGVRFDAEKKVERRRGLQTFRVRLAEAAEKTEVRRPSFARTDRPGRLSYNAPTQNVGGFPERTP